MPRIVFAGTPELACAGLEQLSNSHEVVAVLTQADQMLGRNRSLQPSAIKSKALELGLPHILTPAKLGPELRGQIAALKPDLLVVFAYGKIFRQKFLDLFPLGGINLHPSALPQWRGPSPIEAQLCAGSTKLGITVQRISLEMDAGNVLLQEQFPLPPLADYYQAAEIAAREGARMLLQSCQQTAARGQAFLEQAYPQDQNKASYCKLIHKEDGRIDWGQSAVQIARNCRAYIAWPKTYTYFAEGEMVQILAAREWHDQEQRFAGQTEPGTLLTLHPEDGLLLRCGTGILAVQKLQRQSRKAVSAREFANQLRSLKGPAVLPKWGQDYDEPLYTFT